MCPKYKRNNRSTLLLFVLFPLFILTLFSFILFKHEKTKELHHEMKHAKPVIVLGHNHYE